MAYSLDTTVRDSEPARRSSVLSVDEYEAREAAILNRARRDTANTSTAEARARSAASRAENDAAPPATGPAKATARRSPSSPTLRRARSVTRRLGSKHPKRLLVAELLAVGAIITVSELSDGRAPVPSRYIAAFGVYFVLLLTADLSEGSARLASAFGLLVLAATLLSHGASVATGFTVAAQVSNPHNPPKAPGGN